MKLYRRVTADEAERVLSDGLEDHTGTYLTDREFTGVWVADCVIFEHVGAGVLPPAAQSVS